jgi:hypothetical protein
MEMAIRPKDNQAALADVAAIAHPVPHLRGIDGCGAGVASEITASPDQTYPAQLKSK